MWKTQYSHILLTVFSHYLVTSNKFVAFFKILRPSRNIWTLLRLHFKIGMFSWSKLTFWFSVFLINFRLDKTLVGNLLKCPGVPKHLTHLGEFQIPSLPNVKSITRGFLIFGSASFSQDFIVKTRGKCTFFPRLWNLTGDNGRIRRKSNLFCLIPLICLPSE